MGCLVALLGGLVFLLGLPYIFMTFNVMGFFMEHWYLFFVFLAALWLASKAAQAIQVVKR